MNPGSTAAKDVPRGNWGGDHISLQVADNSSTFELDCAHGTISQALTLDANNRFEVRADYVRERGGPEHEGQRADSHPARFSGWSDGKRMTLNITLTDTGQVIGDFNLELGGEPRMTKCL
ncbi:MAG TPA: hypothetical protein VE842_09245 [Pyrinomonadaceae bacterium]|jgi:hypothetical protein|nr:hypothetical protein [Pyrinomonadaceae bacterium]